MLAPLPRCPHCQGQLFTMQRMADDLATADTVRACLQCGREDGPPPQVAIPRTQGGSREARRLGPRR